MKVCAIIPGHITELFNSRVGGGGVEHGKKMQKPIHYSRLSSDVFGMLTHSKVRLQIGVIFRIMEISYTKMGNI